MSYSPSSPLRLRNGIDTIHDGPLRTAFASLAAGAWPTANLSIYIPVVVPTVVVVTKLWYANGTTATGNYDIGLYDEAGTQLLGRGSTAKGTTDDEVVWDCTDTRIGPGRYYLALASDSSTDTFIRQPITAPLAAAMGILAEATFPLPATASFAVSQTLAYCPALGMLFDEVIA